jgi:hypothetical protein
MVLQLPGLGDQNLPRDHLALLDDEWSELVLSNELPMKVHRRLSPFFLRCLSNHGPRNSATWMGRFFPIGIQRE